MSNPQYQNNEGYDESFRKPCGCVRGVSVCDSCDLDRTLPDRWRRWVHNPAWDRATHDIAFGKQQVDATPMHDAFRLMSLAEAKLKVQRWITTPEGGLEPYGEPVWPSTNKPVVKLRLKTDRIRKDLDDATIYAIQLMVMLDAARSPSLWQRIVGWFRYQLGI